MNHSLKEKIIVVNSLVGCSKDTAGNIKTTLK